MNINVPPTIGKLAPYLTEFFEGMTFKLHVNSHKDAVREDDIEGLIDKMLEELQEFRESRLSGADDLNTLAELQDVGNFAFLIYAYLRSRGVMDIRERFIREFFEVDPVAGKIYCRKTRSGSPLKVGDEITGTVRGRVVYLRTQHTASGATVSVPRRDIIWWHVHGVWPERPLRHRGPGWVRPGTGDSIDRISNLEMMPETERANRYPFVVKWAPSGREGHQNYGKYRYQRRHAFKLVVVGYWDTPEEAATEGLIAWKEKTRAV